MPLDDRDKLSIEGILSWAEQPELEEIEALIAEARDRALRDPCVWSGTVDGLRVRILRADEHMLIVYQRAPEPEGVPLPGCHALVSDPFINMELHGWTASDDVVALHALEAALLSKLLPGQGLR